jgi:hypothetical protein
MKMIKFAAIAGCATALCLSGAAVFFNGSDRTQATTPEAQVVQPELSIPAQKGQEYAEQYGIADVTFERTVLPHPEDPYVKVDRTIYMVKFEDGSVLENPSVKHGEIVSNAEQFSESDMLIYQAVMTWLDEK